MRGLFGEPAESPTAAQVAAGAALVAVERAVDRSPEGLLYIVPETLADLAEGERVVVPLGAGDRETAGYVVRRVPTEELDAERARAGRALRLKPVLRRDEAHLPLGRELVELARWVGSFYCCPIGMTFAGVLPAAVRHGIGAKTTTFVRPLARDESVPPPKLSKQQRTLLAILAELPPESLPIEAPDLLERAEVATPAPLRALAEKGLVAIERRTGVEARFLRGDLAPETPPALTEDQRSAVESIGALLDRGFSRHLLFGVTGSGKTEVYLRLVERTLAAGKRALVLLPEIGLTPQTAGRIVRRLPGRHIAILHSGMTAAERHRAWATVARGEAEVVLGARSAVFAPFPDGSLGLVVVDEEHDASYKADHAPRYHGRDVAIRRAQLAGCPIVLGSATPSLESWWNATRRGLATLHRMPHRAPGLRLPKVVVVDFNEERRRYRDRRVHLIGPTLRTGLRETLDAGGQAVLLLNRRGYANYIACTDPHCEWILRCDQCDAGMVCHRQRLGHADGSIGTRDYTRCHHCHAELRLPRECPVCGKRTSVFGLGTQRVEEELHRDFPELVEGDTLARVDADAMQGERDFREVLDRFAAGRVRVLLGTQMIAKGLDFPNVRLVGVISADTALHLPDFRAAERTYQLVSQVAGRCGRGEHGGTAIIQTFQPQAPPIVAAARHDYEAFATRELTDRELFGLPPARRMARLVLRDAGEAACAEAARRLADEIRRRVADGDAIEVRGPAPCPIARIAGRYRFQIELLAATAGGLTTLLTGLRNDGHLPIGESLAVDVDPVLLM